MNTDAGNAESPSAERNFGAPAINKVFRDLFDSALVIAAFSALFYWIGYLVRTHDAERLGIPKELLPEASPEAILALGFITGVTILGAGLLIYAVVVLIGKKRDQWKGIQESLAVAVRRHPTFYTLFALFAAMALVGIVVEYIPMGPAWRFEDHKLPKVTTLLFKEGSPHVPIDDLHFICRRDGWVVFKREGKRQYVVFRDDNITSLVLQSE